ncbi:membrane-spanning 4-domains subfamily A member 4D-like isoform X2 [Anarrhichthys ocellatus]|uniref:membrane-spanning 4-domains subfamily A member 4D-like isoform X2 n=1 Tax=Anarrhichthys ocellatus TaxID=433405 RepID=UPI0012EDDC32|nr:membrane-spanning 4-domains subfamily A member 4D-like isoform X2 [Anarrhichthys ocellatus]
MSADLYCASNSGGNNANLQGTTVGGSKPLHRFIKGQPKIIGIIALVLGSSFFMLSIVIMPHNSIQFISTTVSPGFLLGTLFIFCGILYILTEHNPTKKTVTMSLALSIVTTLGEMVMSVAFIFVVYSVLGAIIFIVMSCLAVAALRSTKSQAIIVMTTTPDETPVE